MQPQPNDALPSPNAYASVQTPVDNINERADDLALTPGRRRPRVGLLVAVLCGVVLVTIGAVVAFVKTDNHHPQVITNLQQAAGFKFTLHVKRDSMKQYGLENAIIYATPSLGNPSGAIQFDGIMTLPRPDNTSEVYTLVDNKAYLSIQQGGVTTNAQCIDAAQIPPFAMIETSVNTAKVVDQVQTEGAPVTVCDDNTSTLLQLKFAGESFVFCLSPSNQLTHAVGDDLDIAIEYLKDASAVPVIQPPYLADGSLPDCAQLPAQVAESKSYLERSYEMAEALSFTPRTANIERSSCGCKGPRKPCLFVHGLGEKAAGPMTSTFGDYWGDVHNHAPCCTSIKFAHFDTVNQGWDDASLQKQFCSAALEVSQSSSNAIGKLILVTHSMGNVIASSAVATGTCSMSSDVTWVSLAAPMQGSKAANLLEYECFAGGWHNIIKVPATWIGYCPPTRAYYSMKHKTTVDSAKQAQLTAAENVRKQYVSHTACGNSGWGLNSIYSPALAIVGAWAKHDSDNDGLVDCNSCAAGLNTNDFGGNPKGSKNYLGPLNHADLTFRTGDGWWGDARKPLKWFECSL